MSNYNRQPPSASALSHSCAENPFDPADFVRDVSDNQFSACPPSKRKIPRIKKQY